jgi:NADH-quinone oxidoreductase subunit A
MADYLPIVILGVLALGFVFGSILASDKLGRRKRPTAAKYAPYESGIVPEHEPPTRFPVKFYLVAMLFIIFDIEVIFLYPWAVSFDRLGVFGLVEMVMFTVPVIAALVYLLANGALDWGPMARLRRIEESVAESAAPLRTTASTVRRVNRPLADLGGAVVAASPADALAHAASPTVHSSPAALPTSEGAA